MQEHPAKTEHRRTKKRVVIPVVSTVLIAALVIAFFAYTGDYYRADASVWDVAATYGATVTQQDGYIACAPQDGAPAAGYVFYPGGKVEATAYLPYLAAVAEQGYFCALLEVPFRLAILDTNAAAGVMAAHPEIAVWAVGGHSLGGVAAASFAGKSDGAAAGLVLLASYPASDLSASPLLAASVTATDDRVLDREKYDAAKPKLPQATTFVVIAGGNHSQFGMYGHQSGDGEAEISNGAQRRQATDATATLLGSLPAA